MLDTTASTRKKALAMAMAGCLVFTAIALSGCEPPDRSSKNSGEQSSSSSVASYNADATAGTWNDGKCTEADVINYTASFRAQNNLENDQAWADYLDKAGMTAESWREAAVGSLALESLAAAKAREMGIKPEETQVQAQIATDKKAAGINAFDDNAWKQYLKSAGMTESQYRTKVEDTILQQQLLVQEVPTEDVTDEAQLDEFISNYLQNTVARRWRVLNYDNEAGAQEALDALLPLDGTSQLSSAFAEYVLKDSTDDTNTQNGGDIGWDLYYNMGTLQTELDEEAVETGHLSTKVHDASGQYFVMYCIDQYPFANTTYADAPDDQLRSYVTTSASYAKWQQDAQDYLNSMKETANVHVSTPMPEGLPYDVDDKLPATSSSDSASTSASS